MVKRLRLFINTSAKRTTLLSFNLSVFTSTIKIFPEVAPWEYLFLVSFRLDNIKRNLHHVCKRCLALLG